MKWHSLFLEKVSFLLPSLFTDPCCDLVLYSVLCPVCSARQEIDFCRDPAIVLMVEKGTPGQISCPKCSDEFSLSCIEGMLIDMSEDLFLQYNTQKIICESCLDSPRNYISGECFCEKTMHRETVAYASVQQKLTALDQISAFFRLSLLQQKLTPLLSFFSKQIA